MHKTYFIQDLSQQSLVIANLSFFKKNILRQKHIHQLQTQKKCWRLSELMYFIDYCLLSLTFLHQDSQNPHKCYSILLITLKNVHFLGFFSFHYK